MAERPIALGIIPARGGSKSVPRKNLHPLVGKPLVAWSILSALGAKHLNRVIVSTDDAEIAEVARRYGSEVPFLRPAEIAGDTTPDLPVFQHALRALREGEGYVPDAVVHLRPTNRSEPPKKSTRRSSCGPAAEPTASSRCVLSASTRSRCTGSRAIASSLI